ncbi:MAG: hypothetical protein ACFFCS_16660 [Candidatus Hodarchaeota archaeon]
MRRKKAYAIGLSLIIGVSITNILVLVYWESQRVTWDFESLDYYFDYSGFENPNLRIGLPQAVDNQIVFYNGNLYVDPAQNVSNWYALQWQASDPITPVPSTGNSANITDPLLGESVLVTESTEIKLAIFNNSIENASTSYAYELELMGGNLTLGGGRNLFLSTNPVTPIPMNKEVFLNLSVHVEEMRVNGTAPENVVQVFIGMVLKCWNGGSEGHDDTLFIQGIITNTHSNRFYAAGNPVIKCGLYANLIEDDLLETGTGAFSNLNMHVTWFLRDALPRSYEWEDEYGDPHVKNYADQNLDHWYLNEVYLGLETQGDAFGSIQVANFHVLEGFRR